MSTFTKYKIKGRNNLPLKTKGIADYPQPKSKDLPKLHFTSAVLGCKGSGKSFSVAKLLKLYEEDGLYKNGIEVPQRVIIVSPTIDTNPQFLLLKYLDEDDIYQEFHEGLIKEILDDIKREKELAEEYMEDMKLYKRFSKAKSISGFKPEEIIRLHILDFEPPILKGRYEMPPVNFLVIDDMMGSNLYNNSPKNPIVNACIKHRHLGVSIFFILQALKQLTKAIRANCSIYCIYKYCSKTLTKEMYEEVSGNLSESQFEEIYEEATKEPYCALILDQTRNKLVIKQNWDTLFVLNKDKKEKKKEKLEEVKI